MSADKNAAAEPMPASGAELRDRRWPLQTHRHPFLLLILGFLLQWMLLMNILAPTWDAAFYYSYARSLAFDQDLALENDLLLSYPTASDDFVSSQLHTKHTVTGSVYAPFAIGSGLLWLPLLALLRLAALATGFAATSGFEWYLVAPVATFSALTGFVTLYVSYRIATREAGRISALIATLTLCFATPLIYYQFREPLYAHVPSALFNTLFLYAWWRSYDRIPSTGQGIVTGLLLGLAALMRWQNTIYVFLPVASAGWAWLRLAPVQRRQKFTALFTFLAASAVAFIAVFSLQFVVWQLHYGSWLTIPQGSAFMTWRSPFLREILFSSFRGLLPWMPVFGLACIGLLIQVRRNPRLVLPLLLLLLVSTYVNASSHDWFAGGGFGPRRSTGEIAILVLGYAWLLKWLPERFRMSIGLLAGLGLALHQWLLLRFGLAERIGGRVVSMAPNFEWNETGIVAFFQQIATHIPDLFRQPLDVFVLPGSPLHHVLQLGRLPLEHVVSLLVAGGFLVVCYSFANALRRRAPLMRANASETKKAAQV